MKKSVCETFAAPDLALFWDWYSRALSARNKVILAELVNFYKLMYCENYDVEYFRSLCTKLGIIVPIIAC